MTCSVRVIVPTIQVVQLQPSVVIPNASYGYGENWPA